MRLNDLASQLETSAPEQVLAKLKTISYPERDQVQYLLDFGVLKMLSGDFHSAIDDFQAAKKLIKRLEAISISENLGAVTINDTLKSYVATPGEQVLLHELLIINYLLMGQLEAARVEVLQAQVKAKKFAKQTLTIKEYVDNWYSKIDCLPVGQRLPVDVGSEKREGIIRSILLGIDIGQITLVEILTSNIYEYESFT